MRVYLDSSAALKRVIAVDDSASLVATIDDHYRKGELLMSSSLAWVEVARALRNRQQRPSPTVSADAVLTYDGRLATACTDNGLAVSAPSA